jgi:patatin-related protein
MRQKELRIALVCYGGISLAVYMHGVTKELWKLARASRAHAGGGEHAGGTGARLADSERVYLRLLRHIEDHHGLRLKVLADIVAGASAGGINGVFLAQAIHSGQSIEPLTQLWLDRADIDVLVDPDARPWSRLAKLWAMPLVWFVLTRPGNVVSASVAPETRSEVRAKLSRLIRSRWFEPPFGGIGFSRLLAEALEAMAAAPAGAPLLPPGHPLDLFVTATDFKGHMETLRLHSPPLVQESEHRLSIGFRASTPVHAGGALAPMPELLFAARATASFPGAFPPLQLAEIDSPCRRARSSLAIARQLRRTDHAATRPARRRGRHGADRRFGARQRALRRCHGRAARPAGAARGRSPLRLYRSPPRQGRRAWNATIPAGRASSR